MKQIIIVAKAALRTYSGCGPKLCGPKCQSAPCTMLQEKGFTYANKLRQNEGELSATKSTVIEDFHPSCVSTIIVQ